MKRSPVLPELPTMMEAGVPNFEASTWIAVFAAGGTPRTTAVRLHNEIAAILAHAGGQGAAEHAGLRRRPKAPTSSPH